MVLLCQSASANGSIGVVGPYTVEFDTGGGFLIMTPTTTTGSDNGNAFNQYKMSFQGGYIYIVHYQNPHTMDCQKATLSRFPEGVDDSQNGMVNGKVAVEAWGTSSLYNNLNIGVASYQLDDSTGVMLIVNLDQTDGATILPNIANTLRVAKISGTANPATGTNVPSSASLERQAQIMANFNEQEDLNRQTVDDFQPWGIGPAGNTEFGPGSTEY